MMFSYITLFFCMFAVCLAAPNCNRGLANGEYYCFENSIPYRMQVADDRFTLTTRAWGCDEELTGEIFIHASTITLNYDNVDLCPRFADYSAEAVYEVVFEDGCFGFNGVQLGDGHRVVCSETDFYFEIPDYVVESSGAWMLVPTCLVMIVFALL